MRTSRRLLVVLAALALLAVPAPASAAAPVVTTTTEVGWGGSTNGCGQYESTCIQVDMNLNEFDWTWTVRACVETSRGEAGCGDEPLEALYASPSLRLTTATVDVGLLRYEDGEPTGFRVAPVRVTIVGTSALERHRAVQDGTNDLGCRERVVTRSAYREGTLTAWLDGTRHVGRGSAASSERTTTTWPC